MTVVKPNSHFVYVVNAGNGTSGSTSITQLSVGGEGVLTANSRITPGDRFLYGYRSSTENYLCARSKNVRKVM
jgi:hypothetical protein